jgi:quinol monooxygenase YgiN
MPVYSIGGIQIPVYSVWESQFPPEAAEEGRGVTEAIWVDMTQFAGCIAHQLLRTSTTPGHLPVVSQWTTRQHADQVLREYSNHPNARRANELVSARARASSAMRSSIAHDAGRLTSRIARAWPARRQAVLSIGRNGKST